ncbi:FxSxx-COOH system tetratricopeptide repeat protein [Acrocarpospora sp. B8E8]|uniref:FxSxx-COOH system tetratricopeptide repeat protein n=1 Tax=Acrocarpospora sp. B8E8 TaxID=3153572 RepID=UPI00325F026C
MSISQPSTAARIPGRIPEVWGKVPQQNKNFTGRDDLLEKLRSGVVSDDVTAVVPHALHGLGGVGKTQVAIEYAYRYRHEYDLVWWIPADQPMLVRSSLAGLAPHLDLPTAAIAGIEDASAAVLDALKRGKPYSRWLLIFDNADEPEEINEIIPRGPGHVLITSRNHSWQGVVDTVPVDVFTREESIEFLVKRARAVSTAKAAVLAEELGDLPLALEQAGALQAETGMSVDEYLRLLAVHTAQLLDINKPSDYPLSMTAAWSLSVAQLSAKLPEAVDLLRCSAFFGPEPIPRDVFGPPSEKFPPSLKLGSLLADPILLSRAIRELGRYALARIDSVSRTIQVHRLVQALLRQELPPDEQAAFRREVHLLLASAAPYEPDDNASWSRYAELLGHVTPADVASSQDPLVRNFALDIVRYVYSSGDFESARDLVQNFISVWREQSGEDDPSVLSGQRHFGIIIRELGDFQTSFELNLATMARMREVLGPDDAETLLLTNSHGADLRARGDFAAALQHDRDSLSQHEAAFGPDHRRTLRAMNNLALDYLLLGDYSSAQELQKKTYMMQSRAGSGSSKQNVLSSWNGLARVVRLRGEYFEACDVGEEAYEYGVQELGADHPWTLRTAKDLSIAKRRAGLVEEALELAQRTYELQERIFGKEHPDTLAAALCLANALRTNNQVVEALQVLREAAQLFPRMYGQDHPFKFGCDTNLALLLRVNGEAEEARAIDERALAGFDLKLGREHHYSLTCAINLASDLAAEGEAANATNLNENTLQRLNEVLGTDHPLTLACAVNLVLDLVTVHREDEADALRSSTMAKYERVLGPDHPDTRVARDGGRLDFDFDPPAL